MQTLLWPFIFTLWLIGQIVKWVWFGIGYINYKAGLKGLVIVAVVFVIVFTKPDWSLYLKGYAHVRGQIALWWGQEPLLTAFMLVFVTLLVLQGPITSAFGRRGSAATEE